MRTALFLAPVLALVACNGGNANEAAPVQGEAVENVAAPQGQQWTEIVTKTEQGGYLVGNPNAAVKLVEYGSRTCPACGAFAGQAFEPLMQDYVSTGRVSFEYRDFLIHPQDLAASLLGRCVSEERYFPMLEQMFAAQPELLPRVQQLSDQQITQLQSMPAPQAAPLWAEATGYLDFVKQRGLSESQARQCLNNAEMVEELVALQQVAREDNVSGTPSFFINGRAVPNTLNWAQLEPQLQAAGAR